MHNYKHSICYAYVSSLFYYFYFILLFCSEEKKQTKNQMIANDCICIVFDTVLEHGWQVRGKQVSVPFIIAD